MASSPDNTPTVAIERITRSATTTIEGRLHKLAFRAMSTDCRVHFHGVSDAVARDFVRDAVAWVANFEAKYSRFIPDSLIGRINAAAGERWIELDQEAERLLAFCTELVFFTRGAFDPSALPLIKLWNWKAKPPVVPDEAAVRLALELVGWTRVERRPGAIFLPRKGMGLDLGGIGKEYAVDCVTKLALDRGIRNVLVDFGQDVRVHGAALDKNYWRVGLQDPREPDKCWAAVSVTDHAVATSGDYLRHFEFNGRRYGHILDPRTGYPTNNSCRAATVIAPTCTIAGILSTTALILGPMEGLRLMESHPGAAGAISTDGDRIYTKTFPAFVKG